VLEPTFAQVVRAAKDRKHRDPDAAYRSFVEQALGTRAVIDTRIPIVYQDWSLDEGGDVTIALPAEQQAMVYVFRGSAVVGDEERVIADGELALLGAGDTVRLRGAAGGGRLLLLAGVPLKEPVARYGPFV
jgi:redox-sensitive bicupin YhaK (pirin superfamily)